MKLLHQVQSEILERLGRVNIAARQAVESALAGQHRSIRRGLSVEFAGHRQYIPGDDLRRLDWRVWSKTDRLAVRIYEEETHLQATLVVDCSGSMGYRRNKSIRTKLDYARILAAAIGFIMMLQNDAVGLVLMDTQIRVHRQPKARMGYLLQLLSLLEEVNEGGETSLADVLNQLAEQLNHRGLVILLSDCFDNVDRIKSALQHLRHRKQDVRIFQIMDHEEYEFGFQGMYEFLGLECESALKFDADRIRPYYQKIQKEHQEKLLEACYTAGVQYSTFNTQEDTAFALIRAIENVGERL